MTLIERLQEAKEGSRELSDECLLAVGWKPGNDAAKWWLNPITGEWDHPPDPTTSIDAALPNENIVYVRYDYQIGQWVATHDGGDGPESRFTGFANTEALARRVAALKARESGT